MSRFDFNACGTRNDVRFGNSFRMRCKSLGVRMTSRSLRRCTWRVIRLHGKGAWIVTFNNAMQRSALGFTPLEDGARAVPTVRRG
ncbi:MAG: hypothetical protein WD051_12275 [Steroidobacteraceae bacterium]